MIDEKTEVRFFIHIFFVILFVSIISIRYFTLFLNGYYEKDNKEKVVSVRAKRRGDIYDRNGKYLTFFTKIYETNVSSGIMSEEEKENTAALLGDILKIDKVEIYKKLKAKKHAIIKRITSLSEGEEIKKAKSEGKLKYVNLIAGSGRVYPERKSLSLLLGITGTDNNGLEGLEYSLNDYLSPVVKIDKNNEDENNSDIIKKGNSVYLTIDSYIQEKVEEILDIIQLENLPKSSIALVMDAKNGEILAYAGSPDFDPNNFQEYSRDERRNRPIRMAYEPGSVFKIYSFASIFELGGITPNFKVDTTRGYLNDKITIPIRDVINRGVLTAPEIIKYSSNVGMGYASDYVSDESFYDMLINFGFTKKTGIEFSGEGKGIIKPPKLWSGRSKATIAMGQELLVTAIQMITASTVFANNGYLLKPTVIKKIVNQDGKIIKEHKKTVVRKVISANTALLLLEYMRQASQGEGTGRRVAIPGVDISIKTGTAEIANTEDSSEKNGVKTNYSSTAFFASTLVLFPTQDPKISIYIAVEYPKGETYYGGTVIPPHMKNLIKFLIGYLNMPLFKKNHYQTTSDIKVTLPKLPELNELIPNYIGIPLKSILPLYNRKDLNLILKGNGRYIGDQIPKEGTVFKKGMDLTLILK